MILSKAAVALLLILLLLLLLLVLVLILAIVVEAVVMVVFALVVVNWVKLSFSGQLLLKTNGRTFEVASKHSVT